MDDEIPAGPSRRREVVKALAVFVGFALLVAGATAIVAFPGAPEDDLLELVPADAFFFASASLDPARGQDRALRNLVEDLAGPLPAPAVVEGLVRQLDRLSERSGLRFSEDIEPWLGDEIGGFVTFRDGFSADPDGALLFETDDPARAWESIREEADPDGGPETHFYRGVEHVEGADGAEGIVGSFAVFGYGDGFRHVVDAVETGRVLGRARHFARLDGSLPLERLATLYVTLEPAFESVEAFGSLAESRFLDAISDTMVAALHVRSDAVVLDMATPTRPLGFWTIFGLPARGDPEWVGDLPGGSWVGVAGSDYADVIGRSSRLLAAEGQSVESRLGIDLERDLLDWLGSVGFFARFGGPFGAEGGMVLEATAPDAATAAVRRWGRALSASGLTIGFRTRRSFVLRGDLFAATVIAGDDRVVVAAGRGATYDALGRGPRLGESSLFRRAEEALGESYDLMALVDLATLADMLEQAAVLPEEIESAADLLSLAAIGTSSRRALSHYRLVVAID